MAYNPYHFSDSGSDSSDLISASDIDDDDDEMTRFYRTSSANSATGDRNHSTDPGTSSSAGSKVSFRAFSEQPSEASSFTSYENDPSQGSETPSPANSVISLSDSIRAHIYKEEFGRELNNYSGVYRLPADQEEWQRLETQHRMLIDFIGDKYPAVMTQILHSTTPRDKKVLDLGIKDVARDFPFCEAVAVDLVPIETNDVPPNLRSEVDDINLGLQHFYGQFDVVHSRLVSSGVQDYHLFVEHISRIARPGGLIELAEFDFSTYDRSHRRIEVSLEEPPGPPWWSRFMAHMNQAVRHSGGDVDAAANLFDWVRNHEAFENVQYREIWLPAVSGRNEAVSESVDSAMRNVIMTGVRSGRPLLLGDGLSEEEYELLEANAFREIQEAEIPQYTRLQCVYATKRHGVVLPDLQI